MTRKKPPLQRNVRKERTRELFASDEFWEEVYGFIQTGIPVQRIAAGYDVKTSDLFAALHKPERKEQYEQAQKIGADTLAGSTTDVLTRLAAKLENPDELNPQSARVYLDYVKWRTAILDPNKYGEKKQIEVNQNIQAQFLADLKELNRVKDVTPEPKQITGSENRKRGEIIEGGDEGECEREKRGDKRGGRGSQEEEG